MEDMRPLGTRAEEMEKEKRSAAEARELERRQRVMDLHEVMGTPAGRRLFWRLINDCHVMASIFSAEPTRLAYLEGQRSVGVAITKELQQETRAAYVLMVQEAVAALPRVLPPSVRDELQR